MNLHNRWTLLLLVSAADAFYVRQSVGLQQRRLLIVNGSRGPRRSAPSTSGAALEGKTEGSFSQPFLGYATKFVYRVKKNHGVTLAFRVQRRAYSLDLDKWTGAWEWLLLLSLFYMQHHDADLFGDGDSNSIGDDGDILLPFFVVDIRQKRNIVLRAALDVIMTIDAIHQVHGGEMLDYCRSWREEIHPSDSYDSYDSYITYYACCIVLENGLVAPRARYTSVTYRSALAMKSASAKQTVEEVKG